MTTDTFSPSGALAFGDTAATEVAQNTVPVDCAPTIVVCKPATAITIQAALFLGWTYHQTPSQDFFGVFQHPDGTKVPLYAFGKTHPAAVMMRLKETDCVAIEGDFMPPWAYPCRLTVTCEIVPEGMRLACHKYYPEVNPLRCIIKQTKRLV